jgi:hypothetical protein
MPAKLKHLCGSPGEVTVKPESAITSHGRLSVITRPTMCYIMCTNDGDRRNWVTCTLKEAESIGKTPMQVISVVFDELVARDGTSEIAKSIKIGILKGST